VRVVVIHEGGRLLYEAFPDPDPGDGEVVVELRTAAVNRRHLLVRYTEGDWAAAIRELTGGRGVDVVLRSVGSTWADSLRTLRRGGRLVVFGATGEPTVELDTRFVYLNCLRVLGTTMGSGDDFEGLLRMVGDGSWRPVVDGTRPLSEAEAAHGRIKGSEHFGKLVLAVR
jgi:zinc-binding alcohol dehydrogenase/oxidoreductase